MSRYKANTDITKHTNPPPAGEEASVDSPLDILTLLDKTLEILNREVRNLMIESSRGKLNAASARDLTAYIKLLSELKLEKLKELENLTDEELVQLAQNKQQLTK